MIDMEELTIRAREYKAEYERDNENRPLDAAELAHFAAGELEKRDAEWLQRSNAARHELHLIQQDLGDLLMMLTAANPVVSPLRGLQLRLRAVRGYENITVPERKHVSVGYRAAREHALMREVEELKTQLAQVRRPLIPTAGRRCPQCDLIGACSCGGA